MKRFDNLSYRHHYKGGDWVSSFFWGLIVVLIGAMLLARSLGYVEPVPWGVFFSHIWPVLIIFAGLSILAHGNWFAKIISIILMLVVAAAVVMVFFKIPLEWQVRGRTYHFNPDIMDNWMKDKQD